MERRVRINQLGPVTEDVVFELVEILPHDIPADQPGAGGAERLNRAHIAGAIDHDGVARVDEAPGKEVEPLLSTGDDQHIFRLVAESTRDGVSQERVAFRWSMSPDAGPVPSDHLVHRPPERLDGKAVYRGNAGAERDEPRIERDAHQFADDAVGRSHRRRGDLPAPRKRCTRRVRRRRDERAAADETANQTAGLELPIRGHHGCAADGKGGRQLSLGRQPVARREGPLRNATLERVNEMSVDRPTARQPRRQAELSQLLREVGLLGRSIPGAHVASHLFARASLLTRSRYRGSEWSLSNRGSTPRLTIAGSCSPAARARSVIA